MVYLIQGNFYVEFLLHEHNEINQGQGIKDSTLNQIRVVQWGINVEFFRKETGYAALKN